MSARLGIVSLLSIAMLVGLLPAQESAKTNAELRKENAALRKQVKTLQARLETRKVPNAEPKAGAERVWGVGVRVIRIKVPVLEVPIPLDLVTPIVSKATDPKDRLFFSFRRF